MPQPTATTKGEGCVALPANEGTAI